METAPTDLSGLPLSPALALLPMAMLSGWLLTSIYYADFLPLKSLVFSYLISVALYPIFGGINAVIVNSCLQDDN